jgi:hypothetical protein
MCMATQGRRLPCTWAAPKAGVWSDFATGERGDALDLVKAVLSVDTRKALAWFDHFSAAVAELIRAADPDVLSDMRAP